MTLRKRVLLSGVGLSLPLAYFVTSWAGSIRTADMTAALENVVTLQINDQTRERCESEPQWFLAGPLEGRLKAGAPRPLDPDLLPRPKRVDLPFELYPYDDQFIGSSTAAPRFPVEFKASLRSGLTSITAPFPTPDGLGVQMGILTGWAGGPCAVLLARMRPEPNHARTQEMFFVEVAAVLFVAIVAAGLPITERMRKASAFAKQSSRSEYAVTVPASGHDEITALVASFNEAAADIRRRTADIKDREESHRRFVGRVADDLTPPLDVLESDLGDADRRSAGSGLQADVRGAVKKTHDIAAHLANLVSGARLRMRSGLTAQDDVDLRTVASRVAQRYAVLARACDVAVDVSVPTEPVLLVGEAAMYERAVGNLVENAIENNRPGGHVNIRLSADDAGKFSLRVIDDGHGMSEDQLTQIMAVRRFRGDEGKGSPGKRGLGLALVWEVAERSQLLVTIRQASGGGVAVEITGKVKPV